MALDIAAAIAAAQALADRVEANLQAFETEVLNGAQNLLPMQDITNIELGLTRLNTAIEALQSADLIDIGPAALELAAASADLAVEAAPLFALGLLAAT
jgi:hypothetical protein